MTKIDVIRIILTFFRCVKLFDDKPPRDCKNRAGGCLGLYRSATSVFAPAFVSATLEMTRLRSVTQFREADLLRLLCVKGAPTTGGWGIVMLLCK